MLLKVSTRSSLTSCLCSLAELASIQNSFYSQRAAVIAAPNAPMPRCVAMVAPHGSIDTTSKSTLDLVSVSIKVSTAFWVAAMHQAKAGAAVFGGIVLPMNAAVSLMAPFALRLAYNANLAVFLVEREHHAHVQHAGLFGGFFRKRPPRTKLSSESGTSTVRVASRKATSFSYRRGLRRNRAARRQHRP